MTAESTDVSPPAPRQNKRTQSLELTERKILDAAEALFARRGFDAVSTKEIATEAGIAVGSLYYHFPSKDGIYAAVAKRAFGGPAALPPGALDTTRPAEERLYELVAWFVEAMLNDDTFRGLLNRELLDPRPDTPHLVSREIFSDALDLYQALFAEVAPKSDVEAATVTTFALIFGLCNLRDLENVYPAVTGLATAEQIARHVTAVVLHGLAQGPAPAKKRR